MAITLDQAFETLNRGGSLITRYEPAPQLGLGLAESWRIIRPARDGNGVWAVWRDVYWLGVQQATHVIKIVRWQIGAEELLLWTESGEHFGIDPLVAGPDFNRIAKFHDFAHDPESGYPEAEIVQAESLERFVDGLESQPA